MGREGFDLPKLLDNLFGRVILLFHRITLV
jgi:hypothetical protein